MQIITVLFEFEVVLEEAFFTKNAERISDALLEERTSKSLVNRMDKVISEELGRSEFAKVFLLLRAIENVCQSDEDLIQSFIQHGLIVKMLAWFERAVEFLKVKDLQYQKALSNLIEAFYDTSMNICRISLQGKSQIHDIFVLRFGALVTDTDVQFDLRLEAIRTINSILDGATKEERKRLSLSEDHCLLLEELAKVIVNVGDYEMQVAVSESLCRMTTKKWREELVHKWFPNRVFADAFKSINDREFETDCRKFLNKLNSHFGDERRVFTFPCIQAFLDKTELFKPDDENLERFWVDFNLGTCCISFFVNDPEGALWESINLPKAAISDYSIKGVCDPVPFSVLAEKDDQKILTVRMEIPVAHINIKGRTVKIIFESQYDIQNAVRRVLGDNLQLQSTEGQSVSRDLLNDFLSSCSDPGCLDAADATAVNDDDQNSPTSASKNAEFLHLTDESETEGFPHGSKTDSMSFLAAFRSYQLAMTKKRLFSLSASSKGAAKSLQDTGDKPKESRKGHQPKAAAAFSESNSSPTRGGVSDSLRVKELLRSDYTRKKPKAKSALRILPRSSPSSAEEPGTIKHSTPKTASIKQSGAAGLKPIVQLRELSLEYSLISAQKFEAHVEGLEKTILEDSVFMPDDQDGSPIKKNSPSVVQKSPGARKRKLETPVLDSGIGPEKWLSTMEDQGTASLKPRGLHPPERITKVFVEASESDTEMASGVTAAFHSFKKQLKDHFSSRYRKIETQSMESLLDCQESVRTLLSSVHEYRLKHLETFQATVINELAHLEQDCRSLKKIEREIMNFWKAESKVVTMFCEKQQHRLRSLELVKEAVQSPAAEDVASQGISMEDRTTSYSTESTNLVT
ncbi:synaptonemal complex protein 2-like isoform X2 [Brienomyrus brachyistius]|uniref:synaptonemal complex protein 2-like isoform X2 n=1 Tax=Brienomyrus brachyistius TaxID=42636 RepID=UPI0020B19DFE|nr:synaptonemal complex protein 2-like isoform X2 [Brienomyrus brachyistius]